MGTVSGAIYIVCAFVCAFVCVCPFHTVPQVRCETPVWEYHLGVYEKESVGLIFNRESWLSG